jgi:hypothetical protein
MVLAAAWFCTGIVRLPCTLRAQENPASASQTAEKSLKLFLQKILKHDETAHYVAAFRDLDGDGTPEAIVYLTGYLWCGTGGCNMLVLKRSGDSWRVVGHTTVTRAPIYILASSSHGWRNIGVWVQGGGVQPGYEAELSFDGKAYPSNPALPPARRLDAEPVGELVIAAGQNAMPLYGGVH